MISKKKKKKKKKQGLRQNSGAIFLPISQVQTFEGGLFSYGGAIFHFSQKIGLKSTKNMRFLHTSQANGGGSSPPRPPPPPLATLLYVFNKAKPNTRKGVKAAVGPSF